MNPPLSAPSHEAVDWPFIEAGVAQRSALLQAVMVDLYGPQQQLRSGLLPSSLMLRHPGYLRPLKNLRPPRGLWLNAVAMDLARAPEGQWCVVSHQCQALGGLDGLLSDRGFIANPFAEGSNERTEQDSATDSEAFCRSLLASLESAAQEVAQGAAPRMAVLTPGPASERYSGHAELARHLGLPLVEGSDLTVRQQRLLLKTVNGLEPVHGLLSALDDEACDPLELRADSQSGVPGLLQVLRAGHLAMANVPGSGVLETPGLHGFLPALSRHLLHEDLLLPSLDTWWCGEAVALEDVRRRWPSLVVWPTFPDGRDRKVALRALPETPSVRTSRNSAFAHPGSTSYPSHPDPTQRPSLEDIHTDPEAYTARSPLTPSGISKESERTLSPRTPYLRVHAVAKAQGGWHLFSGSMTQAAHASLTHPPANLTDTTLDIGARTDVSYSAKPGAQANPNPIPHRHRSSEDH